MNGNAAQATTASPPSAKPASDEVAMPLRGSAAAYERTLLGSIDRRYLQTPAGRLIAAVLLGAALIVPAIQFTKKINETKSVIYRQSDERARSALGRWLPTAEDLADPAKDINPYGAGYWFPTPPLMLLTLVPLTKLSMTQAALVWAGAKVIGFVVGMFLVVRGVSQARGTGGELLAYASPPAAAGRQEAGAAFAVPLGVLLMAAAFSMRPVISDIQHGNLNVFMAIWLAIAWGLYQRRLDVPAGVFVALAIVTKVTPALALVYFVYKREWRVVSGTLAGLVLFVFIVPGLVLGFETNWLYLKTWFEMLVSPFAIHGYATKEITNQSLYGTALRLLSNAGALPIEHMPDAMAMATGMDDMVRPSSLAGRLLKPALALPIVGTLAWLCRTRGATRSDPRLLLEFGLVLLAMLLLSERTWKHHATTLPIVFVGVWYVLTCFDWPERFRAWFVAGLGAQFFLLVAASEGIFPDRLADKMLDGGFFCWGLLLCFVMTAVLLAKLRRGSGLMPVRNAG